MQPVPIIARILVLTTHATHILIALFGVIHWTLVVAFLCTNEMLAADTRSQQVLCPTCWLTAIAAAELEPSCMRAPCSYKRMLEASNSRLLNI